MQWRNALLVDFLWKFLLMTCLCVIAVIKFSVCAIIDLLLTCCRLFAAIGHLQRPCFVRVLTKTYFGCIKMHHVLVCILKPTLACHNKFQIWQHVISCRWEKLTKCHTHTQDGAFATLSLVMRVLARSWKHCLVWVFHLVPSWLFLRRVSAPVLFLVIDTLMFDMLAECTVACLQVSNLQIGSFVLSQNPPALNQLFYISSNCNWSSFVSFPIFPLGPFYLSPFLFVCMVLNRLQIHPWCCRGAMYLSVLVAL